MIFSYTRIVCALLLCFGLGACSATSGLTVLMSGVPQLASAGIKHTFGGGASTTFRSGPEQVQKAARRVLATWSAPVKSMEQDDSERWQIVATANEWTYELEIEKLSADETKLKVVARNGFFLRDHTKSGQFIEATKKMLAKI